MEDKDKARFVSAVAAMLESFGAEATKAILHGYWLGLGDLSIEQVEQAVMKSLRSCKFTPKPFELRDLIGLVVSDDSRAEAAWGDVQRALPIGSYRHVDFEDKLINATIRNLGGWVTFLERFTDSKAETFAKLDFLKCYKAFSRSGVNGEATKPLAGLSQLTLIAGMVCVPVFIRCDSDRIECRLRILDSTIEVKRLA